VFFISHTDPSAFDEVRLLAYSSRMAMVQPAKIGLPVRRAELWAFGGSLQHGQLMA